MDKKGCPPDSMPQFDRAVARGVAKIIILSYIRKTKTYPYELLKHIRKRNGYLADFVTKNDIYNMTMALEKGGFIKSRTKLSGNKVQKIYTITSKGERIVKHKDRLIGNMILEIKRLVKEEFNG